VGLRSNASRLLSSQSVAQRTPGAESREQPGFHTQQGGSISPAEGCWRYVRKWLESSSSEQGQLIKFSYDSRLPVAATIAMVLPTASLIRPSRRYEASRTLETSSSDRSAKTRGDRERSERSLVAYAQAQALSILQERWRQWHGRWSAPSSDANSLQGASLISLNSALAEATARRVAAEGAYRQLRRGPNIGSHQSPRLFARTALRFRPTINKNARS
jgi:hypothetical protein